MPEYVSDRVSDRMPDRLPERTPDRMSDRLPDRMSNEPRWGVIGGAPQKAARLAVFRRGLTPSIPLLNPGPASAFVNRKFLLTLSLDRVAMSLEHVGPSKMTKRSDLLWVIFEIDCP